MKYEVVVEPKALKEIVAAFKYYEDKLQGLGSKFKLALDNSFDALSKNPFYQIRYKEDRFFPIKKFPFVLIFKVDELNKEVRVYAVFNTHRNPKKRIRNKKL